MQSLVRVSKWDKEKHLPIAKTTLYKFHHLRKHAEVFKKFGGFLFVDIEALRRAIEGQTGESK